MTKGDRDPPLKHKTVNFTLKFTFIWKIYPNTVQLLLKPTVGIT